ncbi:hypothetical protein Tco_0926374 [Tanacetum coccineum]|uniref:Uncharacterized protein n=1 Tax=Tanacetum coccineum TaxID=301880 RepID=A0ABQ5D9M2_9ASTR
MSLRFDAWFELVFHGNLMSAERRVDPFNVRNTPCDHPFMIPKDFKEPGFSTVDNVDEITTRSWLFYWRKAYSRCSGNSFNSSLGGSTFDGFNRFSGAFHSSGSTGSVLGFMLAPKSARAFLTARGPIRQGKVKLPGSPSLWGRILWIMAEHSSLSLTKDAAFSSFSLCERRSFKTLALFDGKGRLSDLEVSPPVRLSDVDRGGAGKCGSWVLTPNLVVMAKVDASGSAASFFLIGERI